MKITFLGHAGLYIETKDCKIMCDPWKHENPQFFGTWFVYPDNSDLEWDKMINEVDFVYVSHIHRDHLDSKFLKQLVSKNKKIKVILPDYRYCQLKNELEDLGFKNFVVGETKYFDTNLITYPSETIDREREDSSLLVSTSDMNFLNINDSVINDEHKKDIFERFGNIDMMAAQFSGANWWPLCYDNYSEEELKKMCIEYRDRKVEDYLNLMDYLKVGKMINTAGPPCFLDKKIYHLNSFGDNASIFNDSWQIPEFESNDKIYRVMPGDKFTYDSIVDRKERPFDKREFIESRLYDSDDTITKKEWNESRNKFLVWMQEILNNSFWLKKYISHKIHIVVDDFEIFKLDFRHKKVEVVDEVLKKGAYYIVNIPPRMFYELVTENYTDWEQAFLSCKCKFIRVPDQYNPWILSFFRNLNVEQLERIKKESTSEDVLSEKIKVGDYEISRLCPHQKYDLLYHGKFNKKEKTMQCLGHGWKWDLNTGKGINCSLGLPCQKIKKEVYKSEKV